MAKLEGRVLSDAEANSLELLTLVSRTGPISERAFCAANAHAQPHQSSEFLKRWIESGVAHVLPKAVWSAIDGDVDGYRVAVPGEDREPGDQE